LMIVNCLIVWLLFPVVLTRRGMRSSTNAYLTALAIADLVYLLCVFWLSLRHYPHVREDLALSNFYAYTWPYSLWLTDATSKYISDLDNALQSELERHFVSTNPAAPVLIITMSWKRFHGECVAWVLVSFWRRNLVYSSQTFFLLEGGMEEWRNRSIMDTCFWSKLTHEMM
jgi:hypothetical protein